MNQSEKIAALKQGDEFIFGEIFNEFHQKLYYYVLGKTKSPYIAEETTQLTFIKLWNNRDKLDDSSCLSALIFQMAKTTCIDLLRKEGNRSKLVIVKIEEQATANNIIEGSDGKDLQKRLTQEIQKMPPVRKKVFELSRFEAKTYKEIAQILSVSEKTVEIHISLALKQLRRALLSLLLFFHFF